MNITAAGDEVGGVFSYARGGKMGSFVNSQVNYMFPEKPVNMSACISK